jgi:magnesium and cobalt exporter, CNNM family
MHMEIYLLFLLILLNGFFAMSEIALVSARRARLQSLIDRGDAAARVAAALGTEPTRFLSTVQIGITSIAMLTGIVGEATLAPPFAAQFEEWGATPRTAGYLALVVVVATVTYFSIVIGELVPKRIGQIHAERVARFVARPIQLLATVSRPFVWLLTGSTKFVLRALGIEDTHRTSVTEEEIEAVLQEGSTAGVIEEEERQMVANLFRLDDRSIATLMTPRADIAALDHDAGPAAVIKVMESEPHSRYPVIQGDRQEVVGVVSARALLLALLRGQALDIDAHAKPPLFVPETITGRDMLERFRKGRTNMAFVVDEYGSLMGLVTLHDVLEGITGQFHGDPEDRWAVQRDDGSWLFDGQIAMTDLATHLALEWPVPGDDEDFETVSGLIHWRLGRIPRVTDNIVWQGWRFEVVDMDGNRIDKVLASRPPRA